MKQPLQQIPTNIITGFLGVGKTTTIDTLLQQKPEHERWAILVNEFGKIGVDANLLATHNPQTPSIFIEEVPGGCLCCAANLPMKVALNALLKRARPNRLLIEPTGLGHPQQIIQALLQPEYETVLDLQATITLVDARKIEDDRYIEHPIFNQQLEVADLIVAHKADLYTGNELKNLENHLEQHQLNEKPLYSAEYGKIDPEWLDYPRFSLIQHHCEAPSSSGFHTDGWLFDAEKSFDYCLIESIFREIDVFRLKAVIKTERGFFAFNKIDTSLSVTPLKPLQQSRVEVIDSTHAHFEQLESALVQAQIPSPLS